MNDNGSLKIQEPSSEKDGSINNGQITEVERRSGEDRRDVVAHFSAFSGPLPPPDIIARYEQILPGSAERIFTLAETQSRHRMELERKVVFSGASNERLGIFCGIIIALVLIGGGVWIVKLGQPLAGFAVVISAIAGVVYSFRYASIQAHKELEENQKKADSSDKD